MGKTSAHVDDYILHAAPFAQPVLEHLRHLVHQACPDVSEAIKWQQIFFEYNGSNICFMGAFKKYCSFGFWPEGKMDDPKKILRRGKEKNPDSPLARITDLSGLPSDKVLKQYIRQAMTLIDQGFKLTRPKPSDAKPIAIPAYFAAALKKNKEAAEAFKTFTPSARKEYIDWLTDAKTEATRAKRLATAIEWISQGKTRQWRYQTKNNNSSLIFVGRW